MAIIKTLRYPFQASAMVEDPQPGSDYIYFQSDAHSKNNLNPYFDTGIIYSANGTLATTNVWGAPYPTIETGAGWGGILMLSGETTHVKHSLFNTLADYRNNLDFSPFASMDPNNKTAPIKYFTDGLNNLVFASYNYMDSTTPANYYYQHNIRYWSKLNTSPKDLATAGYLTAVSTLVATATQGIPGYYFGASSVRGSTGFPVYRNPATNNLVWVAQGTGAAGEYPYAINGASLAPAFSANPAAQLIVLDNAGTTNQFIGPSYRDGYGLFLQNDIAGDTFQRVIKYADNIAQAIVVYSTTASSAANTVVPSALTTIPDYNYNLGITTGSYYVSTNTNIAQPNNPGVGAAALYGAPTSMTATLNATLIGSIAGTVLTAQVVNSGVIAVGQQISGTNVTTLSTITSIVSYNDATGTGTFNLSLSSTVAGGTRIWAALTTTISASILPGYTQSDGGQRNQMYVYTATPVTPGQGRLYPGMTIFAPQISILATQTSIVGLTTASGVSISTSTNAGGLRAATYGGFIAKYASKTFQDVTTSSARGFYVPYVDVAGKYNPLYFQWNTATDVFSRSGNVVVNHATGTAQTTYWAPDTISATSLGVKSGLQRVWYNEMCTDSAGNRFLVFMQLHGAGGIFDQYPLMRSFLVYSISPRDPLILNFASSLVIPQTPKNIVWLNANKSLLAVICHTATYIYFLNAPTGFQLTATFPYQFNAVGTDSYGRAWAHDTGFLGWGRIHLLSGVPGNISVVSNSPTYTYSGVATTTTFAVNAFDITGNRMAANVNLSVAGNSLLLLNNATGQYASTLTVVTNTLTSVVIWGQIINSGPSNINASVTI